MVSAEKGLPETFTPGQKKDAAVDLATTRNVKWAVKLGSQTCSTPAVAGGKVILGACMGGQGVLLCLEEGTGKLLWQLSTPPRQVPAAIDGRKFWFKVFPPSLGICSSPTIDGDRVYIVTHRCEVACLDANGLANGNDGPFQDEKNYVSAPEKDPGGGKVPGADIIWLYDMYDQAGVRPSDASNCSVLVHGDRVYVCTSNGVDRDADAGKQDEFRKPPAPDAPNLIVLEKKTGRLVARDEEKIAPRLLHGQWSSPSLGKVGGRTLVFFGGGDGVCYAFEALSGVPDKPVTLKKAWSFDCNPPEYKAFGNLDLITHYCVGDRRRKDTLNKNDGSFVGMSEIIATPVFHNNRVYVAIGRDPEHGRGKGAMYCIDATRTLDITETGRIWSYKDLDRTLSTASVAEGLVYIADVAGRLHCLDADTGRCYWVHETKAATWGSTLVADGKVYMPTQKYLWVLACGKEKKVLDKIDLGAPTWTSPVAANGVLYVASTRHLWAVRKTK